MAERGGLEVPRHGLGEVSGHAKPLLVQEADVVEGAGVVPHGGLAVALHRLDVALRHAPAPKVVIHTCFVVGICAAELLFDVNIIRTNICIGTFTSTSTCTCA